jgi:hypothetical protein
MTLQNSPWPLSVHVFSWSILLLFSASLASITLPVGANNFWDGWRESHGLRNPSYTEQIFISQIIRTRANTWSNLSYILVGLYAIALSRHDRRQPAISASGYVVRTPVMSLTFGVACCTLGLASGLFHASLTRMGQQLDVAAMYTPLLTLCAVNLGRWMPASFRMGQRSFPSWIPLLILVTVCSVILLIFKWSMSSVVVLSSLIALVGLSIVADQFRTSSQLNIRWVLLSFALLIAAVACRELDIARRFSSPQSWLQGHAFWHILTSLSLASIYVYYRSETVTSGAFQSE